MTHLIFLSEGYYDYIFKFLKYFDGKTYANGKAKVRARMVVPIHFGINEAGYEEFLSDLKSFTLHNDFDLNNSCWDNTENTGHGLKNKLRKMFKWLRRIFPQIKDIDKDFEKVEDSKLRTKLEKEGNHFIMGLYTVGKLDDARYKDGREVVWLKNI